ncbi:MAG TPA: sensor histidine kinase, partial [Phnomibacter sp.]|nr:sensor histidine kinase [Phnomibacter sp.]
ATGILTAILGLFIYAVVKENRRVIRWQKQRIKAEIETLEAERRRIAADLHDELGPMLSAIKMQVAHVEPGNAEETALLQKSGQQIDQVVQRFREISYNLMPNTLVRKGLFYALREYLEKMNGLNGLQIGWHYDEDIHLKPDQALNLYRLVQEIVHNTLKHAKATRLDIAIRKTGNGLHLSSYDNGIGFQFPKKGLIETDGLGLMNMISRAEVLGGELQVKTAPGQGTQFSMELKL